MMSTPVSVSESASTQRSSKRATSTSEKYSAVLAALLQYVPALSSLPTSPHAIQSTTLQSQIADLHVHPTLEAALHLLNLDLPSAHFLLRHMQSAPAHEAMFLHGILHRIEGDYDNTRAWYGNVGETDVFDHVWGGSGGVEGARAFVDEIERWRKGGVGREAELAGRSLGEIVKVIEFCERKFGTGKVEDAGTVWVRNTDGVSEKSDAMIVGGEGWREF